MSSPVKNLQYHSSFYTANSRKTNPCILLVCGAIVRTTGGECRAENGISEVRMASGSSMDYFHDNLVEEQDGRYTRGRVFRVGVVAASTTVHLHEDWVSSISVSYIPQYASFLVYLWRSNALFSVASRTFERTRHLSPLSALIAGAAHDLTVSLNLISIITDTSSSY